MVKKGLKQILTGHYEWVIATLSFVTLCLAYGTRYFFSVFYVAMISEFRWSGGESAMACSINMLVYGVGAIFVGTFVDLVHPKKKLSIGILSLSMGLVSSMFKLLGGFLSDKIGRGHTYLVGAICGSLGIFLLLSIENPSQHNLLYLYSILFGVGYGITAPIFPAISVDLFYGRHYGKIYGLITLGMGIGSALGLWLGGVIFDTMKSYQYAHSIAIVSFLLSGLAIEIASMARK